MKRLTLTTLLFLIPLLGWAQFGGPDIYTAPHLTEIGYSGVGVKLMIYNSIKLENTTHANLTGIIYKSDDPFISDFNYGNNGTVTTSGKNLFIGVHAGNLTMGSTATETYHASYNTLIGYDAGRSNTTGHSNTFVGVNVGYYNTTGYNNSFLGVSAGISNTEGHSNTFIGYDAGRSNNTGYYNAFFGMNAGRSNTTGNSNTFIGKDAGRSNTTGSSNTAVGYSAGRYLADGSTPAQELSQSVFLGTNTKANGNTDANEIVIGYNAVGAGSNSVVLGNDDITKTLLKGNVSIDATSTTSKLAVNGGRVTIDVDGTFTEGDHHLEIKNGATYSELDAGEAQFTTSSSKKIKENIKPVRSKINLAMIDSVKAVEFNFRFDKIVQQFDPGKIAGWDTLTVAQRDKIRLAWIKKEVARAQKEANKKHVGLIAEDFGKILGRKNAEKINWNEVMMVMWEAIRDLRHRVAVLEKEVAELKQKK